MRPVAYHLTLPCINSYSAHSGIRTSEEGDAFLLSLEKTPIPLSSNPLPDTNTEKTKRGSQYDCVGWQRRERVDPVTTTSKRGWFSLLILVSGWTPAHALSLHPLSSQFAREFFCNRWEHLFLVTPSFTRPTLLILLIQFGGFTSYYISSTVLCSTVFLFSH